MLKHALLNSEDMYIFGAFFFFKGISINREEGSKREMTYLIMSNSGFVSLGLFVLYLDTKRVVVVVKVNI